VFLNLKELARHAGISDVRKLPIHVAAGRRLGDAGLDSILGKSREEGIDSIWDRASLRSALKGGMGCASLAQQGSLKVDL
jgi:hypothetical protein